MQVCSLRVREFARTVGLGANGFCNAICQSFALRQNLWVLLHRMAMAKWLGITHTH